MSDDLPHSPLQAPAGWVARLRADTAARRLPQSVAGESRGIGLVMARLASARSGALRFGAEMLGQLLPRACLLCEAPCGDAPLCAPCREFLPGAGRPRCRTCARPWTASARCATCREAPPAFARTVAAADYVPPLDRAITALKFGGRTGLAPALGALLAEACGGGGDKAEDGAGDGEVGARAADVENLLAQVDRIVPVPLSAARLAERGFNQAHLIAAALVRRARPTHARLAPRLLARQRDTLAQSRLQGAARRANLDHGFVASPTVAGLRIAVVDDVMTTGATLEAAAIALRDAGAERVVNLVVARTA